MDDTLSDTDPNFPEAISDTEANTHQYELDTKILTLRKEGKSYRQICALANTNIARVQRVLKRDQKQYAESMGMIISKDSVITSINAHAPKAVETIASVMNDSRMKGDTRVKASAEILDRAGISGKPEVSVNIDNRQVHNWSASPELIDAISSIKSMYSKLLEKRNGQTADGQLIDIKGSDVLEKDGSGYTPPPTPTSYLPPPKK